MNNFIIRTLSALILFPLIIYIITKGSYVLIFFTLILCSIAFYEWIMIAKNFYLKIFGLIILTFSFYFFYKLTNDTSKVLFVIFVCIFTDIGGYVFGKIIKGPKLTKISPNKTYSGMFGSYFLSFLSSLIFVSYNKDAYVSLFELFILTFVLSTISQIGDISISYFKRKSNLKNSGKIIPGHGGLLDRIDGMIFAVPTFYFINFITNINL